MVRKIIAIILSVIGTFVIITGLAGSLSNDASVQSGERVQGEITEIAVEGNNAMPIMEYTYNGKNYRQAYHKGYQGEKFELEVDPESPSDFIELTENKNNQKTIGFTILMFGIFIIAIGVFIIVLPIVYRNTNKSPKVLIPVFFFIFVFCAAICLNIVINASVEARSRNDMGGETVSTKAILVSVAEEKNDTWKGDTVVRYSVDGKPYRAVIANKGKYKLEDEVTINYYADNPGLVTERKSSGIIGYILFPLMIGGLFLAAGIGLIRLKLKGRLDKQLNRST